MDASAKSIADYQIQQATPWGVAILNQIDRFWSAKNPAECVKLLEASLPKASNPFAHMICILEQVAEKNPELSKFLITEFERWSETHFTEFEQQLKEPLRQRVFQNIAFTQHNAVLKSVVKGFRLDALARFHISQLMQQKDYVKAARCVAALGWQNYYRIEDIAFPCLLQDKLQLVELYIENDMTSQKQICHLLDGFLSKQLNLDHELARYSHVDKIRKDRFGQKSVQKLLTNWCKRFNIMADLTPNLARSLEQGQINQLQYYMRRRYEKKDIEYTVWADNILNIVRPRSNFYGPKVVEWLCTDYHDIPEAAAWALRLNMPGSCWPKTLFEAARSNRYDLEWLASQSDGAKEEANQSLDAILANQDYFHMPTEVYNQICVIDTEAKLYMCLLQLAKCDLIGLDTECRPTTMPNQRRVLSLLQIATKQEVFLLDLLALKMNCNVQAMQQLVERLFPNDDIRKLGCGLRGDLDALMEGIPPCAELFVHSSNLICLQTLVTTLAQQHPSMFEASVSTEGDSGAIADALSSKPSNAVSATPATSSTPSSNAPCLGSSAVATVKVSVRLTDLCERFLDKRIYKGQQMSDWSRRPLMPEQIYYAAMDAYCLLEIYEKIKEKATALDIDFEAVCQACMLEHAGKKTALKRQAEGPPGSYMDSPYTKMIKQEPQTVEQKRHLNQEQLLAEAKSILDSLNRQPIGTPPHQSSSAPATPVQTRQNWDICTGAYDASLLAAVKRLSNFSSANTGSQPSTPTIGRSPVTPNPYSQSLGNSPYTGNNQSYTSSFAYNTPPPSYGTVNQGYYQQQYNSGTFDGKHQTGTSGGEIADALPPGQANNPFYRGGWANR